MIITTQALHPPRTFYEILIDGEVWRKAHFSIMRPQEMLQACANLQEAAAAFAAAELKGARRYALRRLAKQSLASTELALLLKKKEVSSHTIQQILTEFKAASYLDDTIWIQAYVRGCMARKMGPRMIAQKLRMKGIASEDIVDILDKHATADDQEEGLRRLLETRYRSRDLTQFKEKQKVIAALMRKGYSFDMIKNTLENNNVSANL